MTARRDPTEIGTDEYGNSILTYYNCQNGICVEIYDLKCERRCNELEFDMSDKNSVIISEERIIIAKCSSRSLPDQTSITNDVSTYTLQKIRMRDQINLIKMIYRKIKDEIHYLWPAPM